MIDWMRENISPELRVKVAAWALVASLVMWPVTAVTVFAKEPQGILSLSWGAIVLTLLQIVLATDIRDQQEEEA